MTACTSPWVRRAMCASSWSATRCERRSRASTWTGRAGASSPGGSWNRAQKTGYKVVRVHVQNGRPASTEDFVSGWLVGQSEWGRPVGVVVAPDGGLLVSDDLGDRIWRVSYGH